MKGLTYLKMVNVQMKQVSYTLCKGMSDPYISGLQILTSEFQVPTIRLLTSEFQILTSGLILTSGFQNPSTEFQIILYYWTSRLQIYPDSYKLNLPDSFTQPKTCKF